MSDAPGNTKAGKAAIAKAVKGKRGKARKAAQAGAMKKLRAGVMARRGKQRAETEATARRLTAYNKKIKKAKGKKAKAKVGNFKGPGGRMG